MKRIRLHLKSTTLPFGNPDTVPAGVYAKEALTQLGEWEALQPKLVFGKDVRQVLTFGRAGSHLELLCTCGYSRYRHCRNGRGCEISREQNASHAGT